LGHERPRSQLHGSGPGHTELGILPCRDGDNRGAALLKILQSDQHVRTTTIMMTISMVATLVLAGQCRQVGRGQHVNKDDVSTKALTTMMTRMERTLSTKERDGNFIHPGDPAQRNGY
jgi:hypothetical protein